MVLIGLSGGGPPYPRSITAGAVGGSQQPGSVTNRVLQKQALVRTFMLAIFLPVL
jgi:hypothetical protein